MGWEFRWESNENRNSFWATGGNRNGNKNNDMEMGMAYCVYIKTSHSYLH